MYRLIFESGQRTGQIYDADETATVDLGRDFSCKIVLEEAGVSRRHSMIRQKEEGIYISDLGSTNGTFVNSSRVTNEHRLKTGDHVEIGSVKLLFELAPAVKPGQRRRRGRLFAIALISIAAILAVELIALGVAWVVRNAKSKQEPAPPIVATEPKPVEPAVNPIEDAQRQLTEKMQRAEELAVEISDGKASSQAAVDALGAELKALRNDITDLKNRLNELIARPAVSPAAPGESPVPSPALTNAPAAPPDPILDRARQMVTEADRAKMAGQFDQSIRILQSANILAPDYVPAYKALAEVYELKGATDAAKTTWQKIVSLGPAIGPPYEEANTRLQEIARKEASAKLPEPKPLVKPTLPSPPTAKAELPRQLRIVELTKVPHPEDQSVDERYEVKFSVRAQTGEKFVAAEEVQIEVKFYDRLDTGEVVQTNAETTEEFTVPGVWESFDRKTFLAQYRAEKGLRKKETEETGKKRRSYGYIVRVLYRGKLQDEKSDPDKLATLLANANSARGDARPPASP